MKRRDFLKFSALSVLPAIGGCGYFRIDPMHVLIRSDRIDSLEKEKEILSRAKLEWTEDGRVRVLYLSGNAYERGYQHGALLRSEVQDNLGYLYDQARSKFHFEELFAESFERQRPFISEEYMDEMHGLAHGSKMPLNVVQAIHALPEMGEWGGKKKIKDVVKRMMDGEFATSCSNLCASGNATADGGMYSVRILDWGLHRISKLHQYPLIAISKPEHGFISANIGWVGFLGAISGMNEKGITLGEMGYGDPEGETMSGRPMPFLLRDVMTNAGDLKDVRRILKESPGTNSFIFLMTDGKAKKGEIYIKDKNRFIVGEAGKDLIDGKENIPAIQSVVYGGHYNEKMTEVLNKDHGKITPDLLMKEIIPQIVMPSNFQDVVYDAPNLRFWVSNAMDKDSRAADGTYTFFDLGKALSKFK